MTINKRHRKHYKSGSCLAATPLFQAPAKKYEKVGNESSTKATAILTRPEYFERMMQPRTTQSMFGKAMAKVQGFFKLRKARAKA